MKNIITIKELLTMPSSEVEKILVSDEQAKKKLLPGQYALQIIEPNTDLQTNLQSMSTVGPCIVKVLLISKYGIVFSAPGNDLGVNVRHRSYFKPLTKELYTKLRDTHGRYIRMSLMPDGYKRSNIEKYLNSSLRRIYPEERFDIFESIMGPEFIEVVIHYPEVTIKNSAGQTHTVQDFFLRLAFDNYLNLYQFAVARTTFNTVEISHDPDHFYVHSHLPRESPGFWDNSFCFGSAPISKVLAKLREGGIEYLTRFLINFEDVLGWESLEGAPYKKMSDYIDSMRAGGGSTRRILLTSCVAEPRRIKEQAWIRFKQYLQEHPEEVSEALVGFMYEADFSIRLEEGINEEHRDYVHNILNTLLPTYPEFQELDIYFPIVDGHSATETAVYQKSEQKQIADNLTGHLSEVKFKGEYVPLKIIHNADGPSNNSNNEVHTEIVEYVLAGLKTELTHYLISNYLNEQNGTQNEENVRETESAEVS